MRKCKFDDFKHLKNREIYKSDLISRLCPDMPDNDDDYKVRNSHHNHRLRYSFAIEISACDSEVKNYCVEDKHEIDWVLHKLYF